MVLRVTDLSIAFSEKNKLIPAVQNLTFEIIPGKTLALMGESGSGKSLTALSLLRLIPANALYDIKSTIHFNNDELLNLPEKWMQQFRGKKIGMIFQDPMTALNPVLTIRAQLKESIKDHHLLSKHALEQRLIELLQEVEIRDPLVKLKSYPHQLSGGQRQRIVIAMAIANRPDILIADEPTTALDVLVQAQIIKLLQSLLDKYQMGLLLITHDLGMVHKIADWIVIMYAGQIVESFPAENFLTNAKHPYVEQLFKSVPNFAGRNQLLPVVSGRVPALGSWPPGCHFEPRCPYAMPVCRENPPPLYSVKPRHQVRCYLYSGETLPSPPSKPSPPAPLPQAGEGSQRFSQVSPNSQVGEGSQRFSQVSPNSQVGEGSQRFSQVSPNSQVGERSQNSPLPLAGEGLGVRALLELDNVSIFYKNFKAIEQLSFQLKYKQTLAIVGESGSGKSSICRALLKLIPYQQGHIYFKGIEYNKFNSRNLLEFRKQIQIIFQDSFSAMNPRMTIEEILKEGMLVHNISKQAMYKKTITLLDQVGISNTALNKYPHHFSGGQRQRLCIARALAVDPQILICDEPTSALDLSIQAQILNLLKSLQAERNLTYLLVTHNMSVVSYLADEVIVLRDGKKVEQASIETILSSPQNEYTKALLDEVI